MNLPGKSKGVTANDVRILVAHFVRDASVLSAALPRIKESHFDGQAEQECLTYWRICSKFFKEFGQIITSQILCDKLIAFWEEVQASEYVRNSYIALQQAIDETELAPAYALSVLDKFSQERGCLVPLHRALAEGRPIEELRQIVNVPHGVSSAKLFDPFADACLQRGAPARATGMTIIDKMLGGGVFPDTLIAGVGPSGTGKTTILNQLAICEARQRNLAVVFQYEQRINDQYLAGLLACATGIHRNKFMGFDFETRLLPEEREKYERAREMLGRRLVVVEMSGDDQASGSVDEVKNKLKEVEDKYGVAVSMIGLDWLGCIMERHFATMNFRSDTEARQSVNKWIGGIKTLIGDMKCYAVIMHQSSMDAVIHKNTGIACGAEFRSLNNRFDVFMAWTVPDKNGVSSFEVAKNRYSNTGKYHIKLIGAQARFELIDRELVWSKSTKEYLSRGDATRVPESGGSPSKFDL